MLGFGEVGGTVGGVVGTVEEITELWENDAGSMDESLFELLGFGEVVSGTVGGVVGTGCGGWGTVVENDALVLG